MLYRIKVASSIDSNAFPMELTEEEAGIVYKLSEYSRESSKTYLGPVVNIEPWYDCDVMA